MVNKKIYEIKYRLNPLTKDLLISFDNVHEFSGALAAVLADNDAMLLDVSTYFVECREH